MMRSRPIAYTTAEMHWLQDNRAMIISDYHRAFCAAFDRSDVSAANLHGLRKRMGWKVGRAHGRFVGRCHLFSGAEIDWLRDNCTMLTEDYHRAFCAQFLRTDISIEQIVSLRKRKRWRTGRTGRFEKGVVAANKGKKMPYNANCARTQFKKGSRGGKAADLYKPIGSERLSASGYLERKIHDGLPMQSRWRAVHLLNWEALHGPIPAGMALKCKGDKTNADPTNWEMIPRSMLPRLNNRWGRNYDDASAELKPTIMAVAKLEQGLVDIQRRAKP